MPRPDRGISAPKSLKSVLSHDYGIPGVRRKLYGPILVVSVALFLLIVPNWYQLGSNDSLLFVIFLAVTASLSVASSAVTRILRRWRK
jgi:hypothetical protein